MVSAMTSASSSAVSAAQEWTSGPPAGRCGSIFFGSRGEIDSANLFAVAMIVGRERRFTDSGSEVAGCSAS